MLNKDFWRDALTRAARTFAQTTFSVLAVGAPIWEMDWMSGIGIGAGAAALSLLMSISDFGRDAETAISAAEAARRSAIKSQAYSATAQAHMSAIEAHRARDSSLQSRDTEEKNHAD